MQPDGKAAYETGAGGGAYAGGRDALAAATPTAIPAVAPTTAPAAAAQPLQPDAE